MIRDAANNVIVNDRLLVITYQDLMPLLERRVAKEALNCLNLYAADPLNKGRYPWASSMLLHQERVPTTIRTIPVSVAYRDDLTNTMSRTLMPKAFAVCRQLRKYLAA